MDDETEKIPIEPASEESNTETFELEESDIDEEEPETKSSSGRSWLPVVAVGALMLVVGLLLGYVGRGEFGPEAQAAKATEAAQAIAVQTQSAANQELMNYLAAQTRHWKGDENAPVTIIEFSDYQ